jgi:hypothetical protein
MGVGLNIDGRLEVFVTGSSGDVWHCWQKRPASGPWSDWGKELHGLKAASGPSVGMWGGEGKRHPGLAVFVIGTDGSLWYTAQTPRGWQAWTSLGGSLLPEPPAVAYNSSYGLLEVFVVDREGHVRVARETGTGSFGGLTDIPTAARMTGAIGAAHAADGRTVLFAAADDNTCWDNIQVQPNPGDNWRGFRFLTGPLISTPAAVTTCSDGRLEGVFASLAGDIRHFWQAVPGGGFVVMGSMGGTASGASTLERNFDGRLEMFHVERDGQVKHNWQTAPNNGWNGPEDLLFYGRVEAGSRICSARNADQRLEVFGTTASGEVVHAWQPSPGGDPWGTETLDHPDGSLPCRLGLREADYFYH